MRVILTGFMILAMAGAAQAGLTFEVVDAGIHQDAIDDDGALAPPTTSWDVLVTSDDDIVGFNITAIIPDGGGLYQHPQGLAGDLGAPDPFYFQFVPALEFDSYVVMPGAINPLEGDDLGDLPMAYGDLTEEGDPEHGAQTDFQMARLTLLSPSGTGWLHLTSIENDGSPEGELVDHVIELPEPATMSLLALGGLAALRRRR